MKKVVKIVNWVVYAACTVAAALIVSAMAVVLIASCFRAEAAEAPTAEMIARMYENDMKSSAGRARWHGAVERREVVTNGVNIVMRHTYEDGFVYDEEGKPPRTVTPRVQADEIPAYMTNGVPTRLANARIAAFKNVKTVTTNIILTVGDILTKPNFIIQYDNYGVATNTVQNGIQERTMTPTGVVTRVYNSQNELIRTSFIPNKSERAK